MTPDQTAYLATSGLMFAVGCVILAIGVALSKALDQDWTGIVIGLGLLCMIVGPVMLIGFPTEAPR